MTHWEEDERRSGRQHVKRDARMEREAGLQGAGRWVQRTKQKQSPMSHFNAPTLHEPLLWNRTTGVLYPFFFQTHKFIVSARPDGPDQ